MIAFHHARLVCALATWTGVAGAATYYVSPSGANGNSGTSTFAPWKTIDRANNQFFNPGDQLLFQGGATFNGTIYFPPFEGGNATNPVTVSSYGTGRATINGGDTNGFYADNCAGLVVSNLNFIGSGRLTNKTSGIEFYNDGFGAAHLLDFIRISQVDVSGFGFVGVVFGGARGTNAYRDVRVTHADCHDNGNAGIQTYADFPNLITNVYVGYCRVWNNPGTTNNTGITGNGILLGNVNNALIERCVAWTNGWIGSASIGIWCYDSTRVTIQYCESHHNRTAGGEDGGGFDLDGGTTSSVMQYNYSHDNDGAGYAIYEYLSAPPHSNNVVRFNISQNDGRKNGFGGIMLWRGGSTNILRDVEVYNNTVFVSTAPSGTPRAVFFLTAVTNVHFRNNLFVTANGLRLVDGPSAGQTGVLFQGNNYWSSGGAFAIRWGASTYATLAAWRTASSQERIGTTNVGSTLDPQLINAGGGGTIGDADLLDTLGAYQLQTYSPLREAGLALTTLFGLNTGPVDYYGNVVPNGLALDVGAHDARLEVSIASSAIEAGFLTASYVRSSPTRTNLNYIAETSTNFANWCAACAVPVLTNNLGNGTESVKLRETSPAVGAPPHFLRLRVQRQ